MSTTTAAPPRPTIAVIPPSPIPTLADLVRQIGSVPLERIPIWPPPGTATEADVLARPNGEKRLCELVDGVLVEKAMGYYESRVALVLGRLLEEFLDDHDLGIVTGEAGLMRLAPGLVRIPDISFISWDRFPNRTLPRQQMLNFAPDLAVEVLSPGNTAAEMERKLREYFTHGTRLAWYVDPQQRTVRSARIAQVCTFPAAMAVAFANPETATGVKE